MTTQGDDGEIYLQVGYEQPLIPLRKYICAQNYGIAVLKIIDFRAYLLNRIFKLI
jgi:hypothetical protein